MAAWFQLHGTNSADASRKALGAIYAMVQRQAMMLSFVEAFWAMGVIFFCMAPLLLLLRNARDLHPHKPKMSESKPVPLASEAQPEPELVGIAD
jgi:hypothetical protein